MWDFVDSIKNADHRYVCLELIYPVSFFEQQYLQGVETLTRRLPDRNIFENGSLEMDLRQFQF